MKFDLDRHGELTFQEFLPMKNEDTHTELRDTQKY